MSTQVTDIISAASTADDVKQVVAELKSAIPAETTAALNVFFSARYDAGALAEELKSAYPETAVIGCSTAGELTDKGFTEQGVSAIGLGKGTVKRVTVQVAEDCKDAGSVSKALRGLADDFGVDLNNVDPQHYLGLVLADGMSGSEEFVMDVLAGEAFDMTFVGASAGDDLAFKQTFLLANGKTYSNAVVLALLETVRPFEIVKTQSFKTTGKTMTVTKSDAANRIVYEFDGKPAAATYAEAVGVPLESITDKFMSNPIGLLVGSQPFVRSPQQREGDDAIRFYCQVSEGSRVHVLQATDMVNDTKRDIEKAKQNLGNLSGMLVFNCILRYLDAKQQNITDALGSAYSACPSAGFNTYGEEYLGHINQTATIVCFS